MITAWQIVRRSFAETAMDGEGAVRYAGRWHHAGTPIVYAADSLALAALETFVHLGRAEMAIEHFSIRVEIPDSVVAAVTLEELAPSWREYPAPAETRDVGSNWIDRAESAVLRVPSVLIPVENNLLMNPLHKDFGRLNVNAPEPFAFDPRLWK